MSKIREFSFNLIVDNLVDNCEYTDKYLLAKKMSDQIIQAIKAEIMGLDRYDCEMISEPYNDDYPGIEEYKFGELVKRKDLENLFSEVEGE